MTSVMRPYINTQFNQMVDDGCLEYKSIPMAIVNEMVKVNHSTNDFTGIKQIYNLIPPRPKNVNAMATSIARISNSGQGTQEIINAFVAEELAETSQFVSRTFLISDEPYESSESEVEVYVPEKPTQSSSGVRLTPETNLQRILRQVKDQSKATKISIIVGDLNPSSGVLPYNPSVESQTEWFMNRQSKSDDEEKRQYGFLKAKSVNEIGGMGYKGVGLGQVGTNIGVGFKSSTNVSDLGHFREGTSTQTELSKPPSGKNMTTKEFGSGKTSHTFFQNPVNREGTLGGTPDRHLARADKAVRASESLMGEAYTSKRLGLSGSSTGGHSDFPSGAETPVSTLKGVSKRPSESAIASMKKGNY